MSGKPAARQGDMTRKGLDIVQGSAGVLIGAPTGVACSVCPGGITYANPVNPVLGAKVLPGETDLALPCPLPFILFRAYSSYRNRTPAPVGVFGPGWKAPFDIRLQIRDEGLILNDSGGRSIHFEPLFPGEISYSRSESLWLARGGVAAQHSSQPLSALWQVLLEDVRLSPHVYLATNSLQGPWWILSWPERVPGADEVLPPEPPAYRVLTGVVDGFGRTLAFHRAAEGDVAGAVMGRLERELRAGAVSAESEAWLAQCGLTVEQMESQMEAEYIPERRLHLYHCDHRGLPQALISPEGETAWRGEYDEWGNQLNEENPHHLYQPYRLPGQQYDEESGLYYNRHRYYDPLQGRYITQDPIGLKGGINLYTYPLAPIRYTDPLGLERVISVYGPPAPDRAGAETPLVLTDMTGGVTIYYDPETGDSMTFDSSNRIDRRSQRGAGDPYTGEVVGCETNGSGISAAYGTTKIYTTDTRARWLHGGGSSLRDPYAPRQGWKPTMGCTRAQNEDVDELCKKVTSWMYSHPGERIRYERFKTR
ncbi:TPA: RHS repeat-associated core domain-containing protein [Escherichia coli]